LNASRYLIVNADDFGLSPGVNQGIIRSHEQGIVTSASLMVRHQAATEAALYALKHPELSLGLHVDLGEWAFVDGAWRIVYEVVPAADRYAVAEEVARQLESFRSLTGRNPTHLDSHQHVHRSEPTRSILLDAARGMRIVVRSECSEVHYCGDFYGQSDKGHPYPQGIGVESLLRILAGLRPGITEMGCHPGEGGDTDSGYRDERAVECRTLCDTRIREAVRTENIALCSFSDVDVRVPQP
jgi:predicted glycoside hydrolase/deacetylase ChbG (UPF0249 family)